MKTLKTLLKEFLYKNQEDKSEVTTSANENNNIINPKNQEENETETDEDPGDNRMANPDAPEIDRDAQREGESHESSTTGGTGKEVEATLESEYERGVKDGRNQQIEEKYFPKTEDGIPHFNGSSKKQNSVADIFSMAREA